MSHEASEADNRPGDNVWREAQFSTIERITGYAPPTCPWRATYDPLVKEVLELWGAVEDGYLDTALGDDPPAILIDALSCFRRAYQATKTNDDKLRMEKRAEEMRQRRQQKE